MTDDQSYWFKNSPKSCSELEFMGLIMFFRGIILIFLIMFLAFQTMTLWSDYDISNDNINIGGNVTGSSK